MVETRAARYGRNLGIWIDATINTFPDSERQDYRTKLIQEIESYSFKPKRKDEPPNSGCVRELEEIVNCNIQNPEHLGKLVKEGIHLMYQKGTSARVFSSLLDYLKNSNGLE